jgi:hypothetical protein
MLFARCDRGGERDAWAEYLQGLAAEHKSRLRSSRMGIDELLLSWATISHFGESAAPAAMFFYSRDRAGKHPERLRPTPTRQSAQSASRSDCRVRSRSRILGACQTKSCSSLPTSPRRLRDKTSALISPIALAAVQRIDASSWWNQTRLCSR